MPVTLLSRRALFNRKLIESAKKLIKMAHPGPNTHIQSSSLVRGEFIARCKQRSFAVAHGAFEGGGSWR
jgi:hypothetical protein